MSAEYQEHKDLLIKTLKQKIINEIGSNKNKNAWIEILLKLVDENRKAQYDEEIQASMEETMNLILQDMELAEIEEIMYLYSLQNQIINQNRNIDISSCIDSDYSKDKQIAQPDPI